MEETQLVALISFIEPELSENEIGTNSPFPVSFRVKRKDTHSFIWSPKVKCINYFLVPFQFILPGLMRMLSH